MPSTVQQDRVIGLMRECRRDFMYAAREFRSQRRPTGWIVAQVRMARHAKESVAAAAVIGLRASTWSFELCPC
jgi:hypothetical protein